MLNRNIQPQAAGTCQANEQVRYLIVRRTHWMKSTGSTSHENTLKYNISFKFHNPVNMTEFFKFFIFKLKSFAECWKYFFVQLISHNFEF